MVTVREIEIAAGAQFIIPILGKMMRMPGLPSVPASEGMIIFLSFPNSFIILSKIVSGGIFIVID